MVIAMMSEDSDYTSDVNFPLQHQHNMSAHQYGADRDVINGDVTWHQQQQQQPYYDDHYGYYGNDATPQSRGRYGDGYHGDYYYYYEQSDERSSRHRGYYDDGGGGGGAGWGGQQRYRSERSDSESEPLSYNSRPQSYYTDRFVIYTRSTLLPVVESFCNALCGWAYCCYYEALPGGYIKVRVKVKAMISS